MKTRILPIDRLTETDIKTMYGLMCEYYEKVSEDNFRRDLGEKKRVILLLDSQGQIQGFSTILQTNLKAGGEEFIALYSGDTVLRREFWGNGALATAFGRYLMEVKLRHPWTNVYWFLISKGYKTYLLMTNNFPIHFPRFEMETPRRYRDVMNTFYESRFGACYKAHEKLIYFENSKSSYLKTSVAEIAEELRKNPRIAYFEKRNPKWEQGVELACVAKVTLWIPIRYALKRSYKFLKGPFLKRNGSVKFAENQKTL